MLAHRLAHRIRVKAQLVGAWHEHFACDDDDAYAGSIAEDPFNCDVIRQEEGAVQQLILMALSDNECVVEQACKTIGNHLFLSLCLLLDLVFHAFLCVLSYLGPAFLQKPIAISQECWQQNM